MKSIIDSGHKYELLTLDGEETQTLTFVKRFNKNDPSRYPGNFNAYPGTTVHSVVRCLLERMRYLQNQIFSVENCGVILALRIILWLMEFRAARRHGNVYLHGLSFSEKQPLCRICGHTQCGKTK